jgi:Xaa-Pro aminopeptidase
VRGIRLDTLARVPLWEAGLDYNHGTGHGVGHFLSVHEGPQSISPTRDTGAALEPGNILSNEPGYYEAGAYGLRIENLILVVEAGRPSGNGQAFLAFETITLCPIDRRLVEPKLLNAAERRWLDEYHRRVVATISPKLSGDDRKWLKAACAPLGRE